MKIEDFYRYVSFELPGCPEEIMRQAVVNTVKDFCRRTHAWNFFMDPIQLIDDEASYELEYPFDSKPITAMEVMIGRHALKPLKSTQLSMVLPGWQTAKSDVPRYYNEAQIESSITLYPTPYNSLEQLVMRVALEPKVSATTVPDSIIEQYHETIASGVKARLMLMPNKQWSAPGNGAAYKAAFEDGVTNARIEVIHDGVPGTIRVQPRRFGQ